MPLNNATIRSRSRLAKDEVIYEDVYSTNESSKKSITQFKKAFEPPKVITSNGLPRTTTELEDWLNVTLRKSRKLLTLKALTRIKVPLSAGVHLTEDVVDGMKPLHVLGLDRAALEEFGLSPEQRRELYRNLYVCTHSFHDKIGEMTKHNTDHRKQ
jgi:hypothetical protein